MARKTKIETGKADVKGSEASPGSVDGSTGTASKAMAAAPKSKRKKAAPKKQPVRVKSTAPKKALSRNTRPEPSDEQIRIRAYFIAERRLQLSLHGDSAHDWIEAKRQLIEEAGPASS